MTIIDCTCPEKEGGKVLASLEDNIYASTEGLKECIKRAKKDYLSGQKQHRLHNLQQNSDKKIKLGRKTTRFQATNNLARKELDMATERKL